METLLENLKIGDGFEIPEMEQVYRKLKVKFQSPLSTTISGERLENGSWTNLGKNYFISNELKVRYIQRQEEPQVNEPQANEEKAVTVSSGKRGRPAKLINFQLKEGEFKVKDLMALNNCSLADASNRVNKLLKDGVIKVLRLEKGQGRGKPSRVFVKVEKEKINE